MDKVLVLSDNLNPSRHNNPLQEDKQHPLEPSLTHPLRNFFLRLRPDPKRLNSEDKLLEHGSLFVSHQQLGRFTEPFEIDSVMFLLQNHLLLSQFLEGLVYLRCQRVALCVTCDKTTDFIAVATVCDGCFDCPCPVADTPDGGLRVPVDWRRLPVAVNPDDVDSPVGFRADDPEIRSTPGFVRSLSVWICLATSCSNIPMISILISVLLGLLDESPTLPVYLALICSASFSTLR